MEGRESLREIENLRFRFQMNNRLRLECLAAVSKAFREFGEPITDELLGGVVFALPQELVSSNGNGHAHAAQGVATEEWKAGAQPKPGQPPDGPPPKPKPGQPPDGPPPPPKPGQPPDGPPPPPKPGAPPDAPKMY
jgi:outer membrane biosynthesis protein TonB